MNFFIIFCVFLLLKCVAEPTDCDCDLDDCVLCERLCEYFGMKEPDFDVKDYPSDSIDNNTRIILTGNVECGLHNILVEINALYVFEYFYRC